MTTNTSPIRFRMRESNDRTDADGCLVDEDGVTWCDVDALRRKADRIDAEKAARPETAVFVPAQRDRIADALDEPSVAGGTLDAMADGILSRWNRKREA